jgi:phosphatidylserine/phosphatidylglycerophosphate/cardiolipin synthase-like enzyme
MAIAVTFLEQGRQQPETIAALLAEFIAAARTSLHIAIYDFRLYGSLGNPVTQALRQRAAAGVDVRIVYDAGKRNVSFPNGRADPAPPGTASFVAALGSPIQWKPITGGDPRIPRLMHHKYAIRDGGTSAASVWTGSTNWTPDSWSLQENNIVCIDSPELCRHYEADFAELWARGDIDHTGAGDGGTERVGAAEVQVFFAPGQGEAIDHALARLIRGARRRIKVCSMLLNSSALLNALAEVLRAGRVPEYGGVYDRTQMDDVLRQWAETPAAWKAPVFEQVARGLVGKNSTPYHPGTTHDFMHNKLLVVDDAVLTGSYNLSHSATLNAENCLLIRDAEVAQRYAGYIDALAKRYAAP